MIKPCSVIHFPGTGGNFLRLCLSLSQETVPYYYQHLDSCTDDEILKVHSLSVQERYSINQLDSMSTFKKIHGPAYPPSIYESDFYYKNPIINNHFDWAIVANHLDNYQTRFSWLKKILYVELDFNRHGHWIKNAGTFFEQFSYKINFVINQNDNYQLTADQQNQVIELKNYAITTTISMSEILDSTDGFVKQYLLACSALNITPELDHAILFYQRWYQFRVEPFI
jgi:hypothetical protein